MIKPIGLEEIEFQPPVSGPEAGRTVAQLTDEKKRRLVWFIQWQSHQDGGLKRFAHQLLSRGGGCALGSRTMLRLGFGPETVFKGEDFESICAELGHHPLGSIRELEARREWLLHGQYERNEHLTPKSWVASVSDVAAEMATNREYVEIRKKLDPNRRQYPAATFLYECRKRALNLPGVLLRLCTDARASWDVPFLRNLAEALESSLAGQVQAVKKSAAETGIRGIVEDALDYSHSTHTLVVINGTERIGKSVSAQMWCAANPDKARYINLTAATTDLLFYGEIFDAVGGGEKKTGSANELRSGIRDTLKNRDIALVFDEGHCLFGLSEKASIKRLEYIRTEFVNRSIPVVLIITPQFANRLSDLEKKTTFNVNQLRGRIARWAELPSRPSRADIECLSKFCLPGLGSDSYSLLTTFALESEYPFAAVRQAATELGALVESGKSVRFDAAAVKKAIGFALFTSQRVAATLPQQKAKPRARATPRLYPDGAAAPRQMDLPVQETGNALATRLTAPNTTAAPADFSASRNRSPSPVLTA